ncbi:MAG TPA: hypothetical protein VIX14_06915 [Terriglobales bacterium]
MTPEQVNNSRMNHSRFPTALCILQWTLGVLILEQSLRFAFSAQASHVFAKAGIPNFIHVGLAWAEIAAAILLLVPRTTVFGGRFLIAVLAAAIVIHLLHGWFDVGVLVVYAAATWAVVAEKSKATEQRT